VPSLKEKLVSPSKLKAICSTAAALLCLSGTATASVIASDAFDYADGALAGDNGGTGWGGAWTGGGSVSGGVAATSNASGFRNLATAIVPTAGQSLYLGLTLGADASSAGDYAGLSFFSGADERLFIGMTFDTNRYGINVTGRANTSSSTAVDTSPNRLIAQILFDTADNITVNLYIDPVGPLGVADSTYTGAVGGGNWDNVRLSSNSNIGSVAASYDQVRIGTTLADVTVPEPSSFALAGLALAALVGARRQRSLR
jgi:hypothetical protein